MSNLIPEKWKYVSLQEIAKNYRGSIVDGPFGSNLKTSDYVKSGVPVLQGKNITNNVFVWSDVRFISKHKADELSRSSIRVGDILMVKIGSIGYSAIVDNLKNYKYAIIPANLLKISLDDKKASTKYIHQYLISPQGKKRILNIASATAQPALSLSAIKKFKIPIPPIIEQKKIASILSSVDDVIEKIQLQINKHQDLKTSVMNELLTKGIGHTDFKDSELGRIPKSWKITELSKVSMILSSNVDKKTIENETLVSLCNYMDVYKNLIITREINFMKASAKKSEINKFLIKKDDVIITKDSETPDDIAISSYVSEDFDNVLCGYHLSIIRSNKSVVDGKFLSLFFKLDYTRHRFSILANGTTRFGLNLKEIENSKILVPSLEEQKKIANIIFSLDDEISTITKKFNKYIFLKKSLMQDLLTGKVRVSVN